MAFAKDFLDGFDLLYKRTDGALESCLKTSNFFHTLAKIEKEYSKSISRFVAEKRREIIEKAPPIQKEVGTTLNSWDVILKELDRAAEHHNQFADKMENELSKGITNYVREKQKQRKKLETDGKKLTTDMKNTLDNLQKARQKYVSLSKEAEIAESIHSKGKGDLSMKPNQLAKLAAKSSQAAEKAAAADTEYQTTLSSTNQKQSEYYLTLQPALLNEFQQFEEDRLKFMKEMEENITATTQAISVDSDIQAYVAENRTGVTQPPDIGYIPWDSDQPGQPKKTGSLKIPKYKGPGGTDVLNSKEWGLTTADQSLSVEDQQNKLRSQMDELDKAIASETKSKDGLENLVRFYASDPAAQKKAEGELQESEQKLQRLMDTKNYVQSQLSELDGSSYNGSSYQYDQSYNQSYDNGGYTSQARGLYDYTATCDTELSFRAGDVLDITEQDNSGWWYASLNGKVGYVPNNYVELIQ